MGQPGCRVQLYHKRPIVAVDDQAGQAVVFAVNQPIAGGFGCRQGGPTPRRRFDLGLKPLAVNCRRLTLLQNAHPNHGSRIVQPHRQETVFTVEDDGQVTGTAVPTYRLNR